MTTSSEEAQELSRLAHEMSNSLAYVTTNLNLLSEELEGSARIEGLVSDALEGAERLADLVRDLRRVGWSSPQNVITAPAINAAKILVVDDEPAILTAIERALRQHKVTVAGSVAVAERAVSSTAFDVILCDLVMPERTGIDWFEAITEERPELAARFVFMTGGGFSAATREFLSDTHNAVLQKPFDAKTLRWVIATHLKDRS